MASASGETGSNRYEREGVEAPIGVEPMCEGFAVPCLTNLATVPYRRDRADTAKVAARQGSSSNLGGRERDRKEEAAPLPFAALHPDAAAVRLDDAPRDRQPEPCAERGRTVRALEVALEDARQLVRRDAPALIGDAGPHLA